MRPVGWVLFALASFACSREKTPSPPADVTRVRGDIEGRFSLRSRRVVVGEPIVADLEVRAKKGVLSVVVGGDYRNEAGYPTRIAVRVVDRGGQVVCDSVSRAELVTLGGMSAQPPPKVETFREMAVLNPMCKALATPGDYRLTLHRRLTSGEMEATVNGELVSCDHFPVHEGALPSWVPPACAPPMEALPSVTSELALHVDGFDASRLRAATSARLREIAASPSPEVAGLRVRGWMCGWILCSCPRLEFHTVKDDELVRRIPSALPKTFPGSCREP